jgi:class 3 adenylate cyclase/tetratricopeptide (TPR) repeat protein
MAMIAARSETVTVLFTDVVGSTAWRVRVGDRTADEESAHLERATREVVASYGGEVVKSLGDGVMATFVSAVDALEAALTVQAAARRLAIGGAVTGVRIGISSGDMVREGSDWVGRAAIEAARLCSEAAGGGVLVADATVLLSRGRTERKLRRVGSRVLRGFDEAIDVFEVRVDDAAPALPAVIEAAERSPIVGRADELARVIKLLDDVDGGECRTMFVVGEPGVGKSRLAAAVAAVAHRRGFTVLHGRCEDGLGAPYQPIVEAFAPWLHNSPDVVVRRVIGAHGVLGQLWPELAIHAPASATDLDPEARQWRLLEEAVGLVRAVAAERPLLLVIDDLHWAEASTRRMLGHLARRGVPRCAVLATLRSSEAGLDPSMLLGDVGVGASPYVLPLQGLAPSEIAELIGRHVGSRPPDTVSELMWRTTDGNPFFLDALLAHLDSVAHVRADDGSWVTAAELDEAGVPSEARDVIKRRLAALGSQVRDVLAVASVIGLVFEDSLIRGVLGIDAVVTVASLDATIQAGLVREIGIGQYAFAHAIVRQAVLEDQSRTGRARRHWLVAEKLDRRAPQRIGEIAQHYVAGAAIGEPTTVVHAALAAAESAMAGAAHEEAADHARAALAALERAAPDLELRFDVLRTLGSCLNALFDVVGSAHAWLEAADVARQLSDPDRLFASVVGYGYLVRTDDDGQLTVLLDDVLALVGSEDSPLRASALGQRAVPTPPLERTAGGDWEMIESAVAMARRTGDEAAIVMTLRSRLKLETCSPDAEGMLRDASEVVARGGTASIVGRDSAAVFRDHAAAFLRLGRVAEARAAFAEAGREADRNGLRISRALAQLFASGLALADGQFDVARRLTDQARNTAGLQDQVFELVRAAQVTANRLERGRLDDVISALRWLEGNHFDYPAWTAMLASCLAGQGAGHEARGLLSRLVDNEQGGYRRDFAAPLSIRHLTETCRQLNDAARAARLLPHVAQWGGQLLYLFTTFTVEGAADRSTGHLLAALGRFEEADASYARAAALERSGGFSPLLARTEYWHARCLIDRSERDDHRRAKSMLDDVTVIADRLEMRHLAQQARVLRDGERSTARR